MYSYLVAFISSCVFIVVASSCTSVKNFQYLQGPIDTARVAKVHVTEPAIQKGDILGITVFSDDPLATLAVTNPVTNNTAYSTGSGTANGSISGSTSGSSSVGGCVVN